MAITPMKYFNLKKQNKTPLTLRCFNFQFSMLHATQMKLAQKLEHL